MGGWALLIMGVLVAIIRKKSRCLADLYHHLHHNNRGGVVDAVQAMGFSSKRMDEDYINTFATQLFDRNIVDGGLLSLNDFERQRGEKVRKIPRKYMLTCRVSLLLRGLGARVGVPGLSMAFVAARGGAGAAALIWGGVM